VAEFGRKCGLTIERTEIVEALRALVEMPSMDMIEEDFRTHFYATRNGLDLQSTYRSAGSWPFAGEGELRCDWRPPESWGGTGVVINGRTAFAGPALYAPLGR
jgi:hypothetical protein